MKVVIIEFNEKLLSAIYERLEYIKSCCMMPTYGISVDTNEGCYMVIELRSEGVINVEGFIKNFLYMLRGGIREKMYCVKIDKLEGYDMAYRIMNKKELTSYNISKYKKESFIEVKILGNNQVVNDILSVAQEFVDGKWVQYRSARKSMFGDVEIVLLLNKERSGMFRHLVRLICEMVHNKYEYISSKKYTVIGNGNEFECRVLSDEDLKGSFDTSMNSKYNSSEQI